MNDFRFLIGFLHGIVIGIILVFCMVITDAHDYYSTAYRITNSDVVEITGGKLLRVQEIEKR